MKQSPKKEDYLKTLHLCEETKIKIEELQILLEKTIQVGLLEKYKENSSNLINWLEEIEFNLVEILENEQN